MSPKKKSKAPEKASKPAKAETNTSGYPKVRSRFTERLRVQKAFKLPSLTQQHYAAECDVRNIIARFVATGELPQKGTPEYGDQEMSFEDRQNAIAEARSAFESLPDEVRESYGTFENWIDESVQTGMGEEASPSEDGAFSPADTERSDGGEAPSVGEAETSSGAEGDTPSTVTT